MASELAWGTFRRSMISVDFEDFFTGRTVRFCFSKVASRSRRALRAARGRPAGWLHCPASGPAELFLDFPDLPERLVPAAVAAAAAGIGAKPTGQRSSPSLELLLRDVLSSDRVDDGAKTALVELPWMSAHPDAWLAAIPARLRAPLRAALHIDERWMDLAHPVPPELARISEALVEPAELAELRDRRATAEEELRRQEEERRREAEEKRRLEEEARARAEHARREREEALRSALSAGRGRMDSSGFVMTEEFQAIFDRIESGDKLLFVTGRPGTGKSTLVRALRERLKSRNAAFLSFTGTAALNIGGQTINSFFAMPPRLLQLGWTNASHSFRVKAQALEVIVVDEVSMVRPDMLDAMDSSLRAARRDPRPFGGVQLVLVGDLYQLPPVIERDPALREYYRRTYHGERFFFAARALAGERLELLELTKVFRQTEAEYLELLARIRDGSVSGDDLDRLNARLRMQPDFGPGDFHVVVVPRRETAARTNQRKLDELPGTARVYEARFEGDGREPVDAPADGGNKFPADVKLELKPGAQVMLLKNDPGKQWTNGDLGIVEELRGDTITVTTWSGTWRIDRAKWPLVRYEIDRDTHRLVATEYGSFEQFPLRLAWASTIHKMQGQTVDRLVIDLTGGTFEAGMTYVALSRCRTLAGMRLTRPVIMADLLTDEHVRTYLERLARKREH